MTFLPCHHFYIRVSGGSRCLKCKQPEPPDARIELVGGLPWARTTADARAHSFECMHVATEHRRASVRALMDDNQASAQHHKSSEMFAVMEAVFWRKQYFLRRAG